MTQAALPALAEDVQTRDRQLRHLVDLTAGAEAGAALRRAALTTGADGGVLAAASALAAGDVTALDRLVEAAASPQFTALLPLWIGELREIASLWPASGASAVATALELWQWTSKHLAGSAQVRDELADALCPLLAARCFALDVAVEAPAKADLCHVYCAHASAVAAAACTELVFGWREHLVSDAEGCATCWSADELDELEAVIPGFAYGARTSAGVIEPFVRLRNRLDICLTGARIAKDRAVAAFSRSV